ncbi:MAG: serine hydrolase domain-containing protein, partial [Bacteroidota bacterium]
MSKYSKKNFGITESSLDFLRQLSLQRRVVVTLFGSPYSLKYFDDYNNVLVAYEEDAITEDLAAQALFGANAIKGKLPITASPLSSFGTGIETKPIFRMGYSIPERVGMRSDSLGRIAEMAKEIIKRQAAPGCQVLVIKDNKVVYNEAFGYQTYSKKKPINIATSYDIASITKVAATTLAVMKMMDEGLIDIYATIGTYLPEAVGTNKEHLSIRDIMAHHARLIGWLPFYKETITASKRNPIPMYKYYRKTSADD